LFITKITENRAGLALCSLLSAHSFYRRNAETRNLIRILKPPKKQNALNIQQYDKMFRIFDNNLAKCPIKIHRVIGLEIGHSLGFGDWPFTNVYSGTWDHCWYKIIYTHENNSKKEKKRKMMIMFTSSLS
jgi:hypothetical protein